MTTLVVFRTERLSIRRWRPEDEPGVRTLYSDPRVVPFIDDGQAITAEEASAWMRVTQANYAKRGYGMFAVELRQTGDLVGFGGFVHPGDQLEPEVKYAFLPEAWGKGLATEFVRGLLSYGWNDLGLKESIATVAPKNAASLKVLSKCGFTHRGTRTEDDGSLTAVLGVDLRAGQ